MLGAYSAQAQVQNYVVVPGDTLTKYFKKHNLSNRLLINLLNSGDNAKYLNNLRIGNRLVIRTSNRKFKELRYQINSKQTLVSRLEGKRFFNSIINHQAEYSTPVTKIIITVRSTLAQAFSESGLTSEQLIEFLDITAGVISPEAISRNERFSIYMQDAKIIAIESRKRSWYLWDGLFFDAEGTIASPMFLQAPLKYKRISSGFSYSRMHPILKIRLPHRAIDYAANKGTKIYAAADGVVSYRGYKGALGNTVNITHEHGYETTYAHMSRFRRGVVKGTKVKRGQVIGYVGSTGRSTGNHLHYELKKDGEYKNPLTHKPQLVYRIRGKEKAAFDAFIKRIQRS